MRVYGITRRLPQVSELGKNRKSKSGPAPSRALLYPYRQVASLHEAADLGARPLLIAHLEIGSYLHPAAQYNRTGTVGSHGYDLEAQYQHGGSIDHVERSALSILCIPAMANCLGFSNNVARQRSFYSRLAVITRGLSIYCSRSTCASERH